MTAGNFATWSKKPMEVGFLTILQRLGGRDSISLDAHISRDGFQVLEVDGHPWVVTLAKGLLSY